MATPAIAQQVATQRKVNPYSGDRATLPPPVRARDLSRAISCAMQMAKLGGRPYTEMLLSYRAGWPGGTTGWFTARSNQRITIPSIGRTQRAGV